MCDVFCNTLKGWGRAFTRTEMFLSVLECVLLGIFTLLLVFTILHFLVCHKTYSIPEEVNLENRDVGHQDRLVQNDNVSVTSPVQSVTTPPEVQCTWRPADRTEAPTHYYEQENVTIDTASTTLITTDVTHITSTARITHLSETVDANHAYKQFVLALVKVRPPQDLTFGCILVKITRYWTLTAASCIEAIEEVDSLDSFFMLEDYSELKWGRTHVVADVRIHPLYGGINRTYDLVALRSEDELGEDVKPVTLPTLLDYYFTVLGEKLTLLGYGQYRHTDSAAAGRGLRAASLLVVAAGRCEDGAGGWAARHLTRPRPAPAGHCGARLLCCGPRADRAQPCNYCGGSPLLAAPARLLGLMVDSPQCGVSCEPALFVNLAMPAVRGWLSSVVAV